jgi:hypothetical protein
MNSALKPSPPALPDTTEKFLSLRKVKSKRTLNDQVEDLHIGLYEDETYVGFLYAVYDEQAIEGSLAADNLEAANMVREKAKKAGYDEVARQKKATIAKALGVVMRRYEQSRNERRNTLRGERVPSNDGD